MTKKNNIIETYTVPQPSDNLADRIIMTARKLPQKKTLAQRLTTLFNGFQTPALSYSFASILIVGLLVGGVLYNGTQTNSPANYSLEELFDDGDNLLIL